MPATASATPISLVILLGALFSLCLFFAPSALAVLRGNVFKGQVIKFQIIILVITIVLGVVVSVLGVFTATVKVEHHETTGTMTTITEDGTMAEPEPGGSVASRASGAVYNETI